MAWRGLQRATGLWLLPLVLAACGSIPDGLAPTVDTGGPRVRFDLLARPLPEIPFPNDLATVADADSPTGLRINVSLIAPTEMERHVREKVNELDGFSTFGSLWVAFDAPLDVANIKRRHVDNDTMADDAVYLIDLSTGEPVPLDLGRGNFPLVLEEPDAFFKAGKNIDLRDWDARRETSNFLFDTVDEDVNGNGRLDPGEDTDHDGVLDRPNLHPVDDWHRLTPRERQKAQYDRLLTFYERETNTLIIRPIVPLKPRTRYAVVLTDRLVGEDDKPVVSPFAHIHHLRQGPALAPLADELTSGPHAARFGGLTLGGTGAAKANRVAFAWSFTTQSTTDDLVAVREGLNGRGSLAWMADAYPAEIRWEKLFLDKGEVSPAGYTWDGDQYWANSKDFKGLIGFFVRTAYISPPASQIGKVTQDIDYIAGMAFGRITVPNLLRINCKDRPATEVGPYTDRVNQYIAERRVPHPNPDAAEACVDARTLPPDPDAAPEPEYCEAQSHPICYGLRWDGAIKCLQRELEAKRVCPAGAEARAANESPTPDLRDEVWKVNTKKGTAEACPEDVGFVLVLPKATEQFKPPFPVAVFVHGYTLNRMESVAYAAYLAKFGIASIGIDAAGHGNATYPADMQTFGLLFDTRDFPAMNPAVNVLGMRRARDLLRMGFTDDGGGDYWTADTFHTRDMVRQSVVDLVQLVRALKRYDGVNTQWNNTDHPGVPAGDFDGDGVVDLGGLVMGGSPGPDGKPKPQEYYVWGASLGGIVGMIAPAVEPSFVAAAPVSGGGGLGDIAVRSVQAGVKEGVQLKILAPMIVFDPAPPREFAGPSLVPEGPVLPDGQALSASWVASDWFYAERHPIGALYAKPGEWLRVTNLKTGHMEQASLPPSMKLALPLQADVEDPVRIDVIDPATQTPLPGRTLTKQKANFRYMGRYFCEGDPIRAPTHGWGYRRNTPQLRRFVAIAQMILDPADPINYARHVFLDPLYRDESGAPMRSNLFVVNTVGDMNVPINSGVAFARAAGLLDHDAETASACSYGDTKPDDMVTRGYGGPNSQARYGHSANDMLIRNHALEAVESLGRWKAKTFARDGAGKLIQRPDGSYEMTEIDGLFDPDDLDEGSDGYDAPSPVVPLRFSRSTLTEGELQRWAEAGCAPRADLPRPAGESAMRMVYLKPTGMHTFEWFNPVPKDFAAQYYVGNSVAHFFRYKRLADRPCMQDQDACGLAPPRPGVP